MTARYLRGLGDTNILICLERLAVDQLPAELLTSAVSLAELSAGVHSAVDARERARRVLRVQRVEATFSPLPFDVEAARQYGIIAAETISMGRKPRGRVADLMIAGIAAANKLPLFTTNPADFRGLESVVTVVPVPVPAAAP
ncbi:type II toxin-antitoxin system VapC family toxin [Frankia sp. Cas4]|uniref:type II toxin-antitoxin system VapC family toxin n=1 Tax=Frankia sp. Cas4 TaxID=3073927 RepID=UPI002AD2BDF7|nr:type II toxin-antitoxin system VapC family toxin [Frankia sp. Cas4]